MNIEDRLKLDVNSAAAGLNTSKREQIAASLTSQALSLVFLTSAEVATLLSLTEDTISRWCREQRFPGAFNLHRAGWRVPVRALLAYCAQTTPLKDPSSRASAAVSFDTSAFSSWRSNQ